MRIFDIPKRVWNLGSYLAIVIPLTTTAIIADVIYEVVAYKYRVPTVAFAIVLITAFV